MPPSSCGGRSGPPVSACYLESPAAAPRPPRPDVTERPGPSTPRPPRFKRRGRTRAGTLVPDGKQESRRSLTDMPPGPGSRDVTPLPDLLHGRSRAGPVRQARPVYLDLLPPCNAGCPAGENIQAWLAYAETGDHEGAWRQLTADNPMPAIHGRVCYHPCESVCNRASLDSAVSIHSVERFLGDLALERGWSFDPPPVPSGKRVLVIGAGPSGLSALPPGPARPRGGDQGCG